MGKNKAKKPKKKKKTDKGLPYCNKAPSAEHARAHDVDEPCDDGRTGEAEDN